MADWEDGTTMFTIGKVDGGQSSAASGSLRQESDPHKGLVIRANKHKGDTWTKKNQREIDIIQDKAFLELLAATAARNKKEQREKGGKHRKKGWS